MVFQKFTLQNWKNGVLDGLGRIMLDNGDIYDGYFKKGSFNGLGVYFNKESNSYIYGKFQNNQSIMSFEKGQGYPEKAVSNHLNLKKIKFVL